MTVPVESMETVLGIAEKYQDAMRRVNKLIGDTQIEIKQRITTGTSTESDLELVKFVEKLLVCLTLD